jgi:hypothetical protein
MQELGSPYFGAHLYQITVCSTPRTCRAFFTRYVATTLGVIMLTFSKYHLNLGISERALKKVKLCLINTMFDLSLPPVSHV